MYTYIYMNIIENIFPVAQVQPIDTRKRKRIFLSHFSVPFTFLSQLYTADL